MAAQLIQNNKYILGIDYGEARLGLAVANSVARLPRPLTVMSNDEGLMDNLLKVVSDEDIGLIVVGLPRNQSGLETAQTKSIREFINNLKKRTSIEVLTADESLSSVRAEEMARQLKGRDSKQPADDLAACFILESYLQENN